MRLIEGRVYSRRFGTLLPDHPSSHLSFQKVLLKITEMVSEPSMQHCAGSMVSEGRSQARMQQLRVLVDADRARLESLA